MSFYDSHSGMFTSNRDDWETPAALFRELDAIHHFELDPFSNGENAKCERFLTKDDDALKTGWGGVSLLREHAVRARHGGVRPPLRGERFGRRAPRASKDGHRMVLAMGGAVRGGAVHQGQTQVRAGRRAAAVCAVPVHARVLRAARRAGGKDTQ